MINNTVTLPYPLYTEIWSTEPFKDGIKRKGYITAYIVDETGAYAFWTGFNEEFISAEFLIEDLDKEWFLEK